jgi:hypothetical protein
MGEATGSQVQTGGMSMRRERRNPTRAEWRQITSSRPVVRRYPKTALSPGPIPQGPRVWGTDSRRIIPRNTPTPPGGPGSFRPGPSGIPDSVEKNLPLRPNRCLTIGEEQDLDVERAERVEVELTRLIERRDAERRESEGERRAEELWEESVRRHLEIKRRQNRAAWVAFFCRQAEAHRKLSERYDARAEALCQTAEEAKGVGV